MQEHNISHTGLLIGSLVAFFCGPILVYLIYVKYSQRTAEFVKNSAIYKLVSNKFYVDEAYNFLFVLPIRMKAFMLWLIVDHLIIDKLLVNGSASLIYFLGRKGKIIQSGYVNNSLMFLAGGILIILFFLGYKILA